MARSVFPNYVAQVPGYGVKLANSLFYGNKVPPILIKQPSFEWHTDPHMHLNPLSQKRQKAINYTYLIAMMDYIL